MRSQSIETEDEKQSYQSKALINDIHGRVEGKIEGLCKVNEKNNERKKLEMGSEPINLRSKRVRDLISLQRRK
jgi:hypothetical protein